MTSMVGATAENNSLIRANKHKGSVKLDTPSLKLTVSATDASRNRNSADAVLTIFV